MYYKGGRKYDINIYLVIPRRQIQCFKLVTTFTSKSYHG